MGIPLILSLVMIVAGVCLVAVRNGYARHIAESQRNRRFFRYDQTDAEIAHSAHIIAFIGILLVIGGIVSLVRG